MKKKEIWIKYAADFWRKRLIWNIKDDGQKYEILFLELVRKFLNITLIDFDTIDDINDYPLYENIFASFLQTACNFVDEIYSNFVNDIILLKEKWGVDKDKFRAVNCASSDFHRNGKCVIVFDFSDQKILYKPRNMSIDVAWNKFSEELFGYIHNRWGTAECINCSKYGWQKYIEYQSSSSQKETRDYYYNLGSVSAVLYSLCGIDFHEENIIANHELPFIIDVETLLQNTEKSDVKEPEFIDTVLETSIYPTGITDVDVSAYSGKNTKLKRNIPYSEVAMKTVDYSSKAIEGFYDTYEYILNNKLIIKDMVANYFSKTIVRIIIRDTYIYSKIQKNLLKKLPMSCKEAFLYKKNYYRNFLEKHISNSNLVDYELLTLEKGDIPYFYMNASEKVLACAGDNLRIIYKLSPIERAMKRIDSLSIDDLDKQVNLLEKILYLMV